MLTPSRRPALDGFNPRTLIQYSNPMAHQYTVRTQFVQDGKLAHTERVVPERMLRAIGDASIMETAEIAKANIGEFIPVSNHQPRVRL